jgi:hypothetical protein
MRVTSVSRTPALLCGECRAFEFQVLREMDAEPTALLRPRTRTDRARARADASCVGPCGARHIEGIRGPRARYAGRALVAATGEASSEPPPARSSTLAIKQKHAMLANEYTTASVSEYVLVRGRATRPGCSP